MAVILGRDRNRKNLRSMIMRNACERGIRWLVTSVTVLPRNFLLRRMPRECVCAEIGAFKGDFTVRILQSTRPRKLHVIDPWKFESEPVYQRSLYGGRADRGQARMDGIYRGVLERFRQELETGTLQVHRRSSIGASEAFENEYFDWIYVDGNHLYEFVKKDLESFYPKVKVGGYITGDDYALKGWWNGGVKKAVDEFADTMECDRVLFKRNQFILRKRA